MSSVQVFSAPRNFKVNLVPQKNLQANVNAARKSLNAAKKAYNHALASTGRLSRSQPVPNHVKSAKNAVNVAEKALKKAIATRNAGRSGLVSASLYH